MGRQGASKEATVSYLRASIHEDDELPSEVTAMTRAVADDHASQQSAAARISRTVLPVLIAVLAAAAGAIHLARNYLPMGGPPGGSGGPPPGGPPPGAGGPPGGEGGLMSLVMPHLSELFLLNFVAFVGLAVVLVLVARVRPPLRIAVDLLLVILSAATLYAWNATGRVDPAGMGTMALWVELALIVLAVIDAALVVARPRATPSATTPQP